MVQSGVHLCEFFHSTIHSFFPQELRAKGGVSQAPRCDKYAAPGVLLAAAETNRVALAAVPQKRNLVGFGHRQGEQEQAELRHPPVQDTGEQ